MRWLSLCLLVAALGVAAALRLPALGVRPMHHDEANQAVRCCAMLVSGGYAYDPCDHHGPSLYYVALPFIRMAVGHDASATSETMFRLVTACAGIILVALFWLLRDAIEPEGAAAAALLAAASPALVYFSRFFIQEPLFVLFTLGFMAACWRYWRARRIGWALVAGVCAGLMHATKETSAVAFAVFGAAVAAAWLLRRSKSPHHPFIHSSTHPFSWAPPFLALIAAMAVSVLFYSSFLTHPRGVLDSLRACGLYARQFAYAAEGHPGPWNYYLRLLGMDWPVALLALVGVVGACMRTRHQRGFSLAFLRAITVYTACTLAVYSLAPHKTPWCVLPILLGVLILAGAGAAWAWAWCRTTPARIIGMILFGSALVLLARRTVFSSFGRPADERNPYAYQQTSTDFLKLVARVRAIGQASGHGTNLYIQVVTSPTDAWPLPWYLRAYPYVGYWTNTVALPRAPSAAIIIATPDFGSELEPRMGTNYHHQYFGLRPDTLLEFSVRADLDTQ